MRDLVNYYTIPLARISIRAPASYKPNRQKEKVSRKAAKAQREFIIVHGGHALLECTCRDVACNVWEHSAIYWYTCCTEVSERSRRAGIN